MNTNNDYFTKSPNEVLSILQSSKTGISQKEAQTRLEKYGYNELEKEDGNKALSIFIGQFKNSLILLLIFAGIISLFLHEKIESLAIFGIVILNAVLGFIQEYRAEKSIEVLEKITAPNARVLRNGKEEKIPAREIVPGDIILLEAGDIVPADSRLIEISSLQIDEASLTGESVPSQKTIESYKTQISVADQENMAFMGTAVTYGKGKCVAVQTGMNTEFGRIAKSLQTTKEVKTPLQVKFEKLAKQIGTIAIILIIIVMVTGVLQGTLTFGKMLLFALTLTVAVVPNALPLVVTVGLSMGIKRLAKKNLLVKKLPAAESLGAATIICSDKTGTITKNQMTITDLYCNGKLISVTGSGYKPDGNFFEGKKQVNPKEIELLLRTGYLCNNAKLNEKQGKYEIIGDPTEGSLIVLGQKSKIDVEKGYKFIQELPFDSDRKLMSVIYQNITTKKKQAFSKGAPDLLLKKCNRIIENGKVRKLTLKEREKILKTNNSYAQKALRVLAIAYKDVNESKYDVKNVEKNLVFIGLVGMIDPPRDEVKRAVEQCKAAGIKTMIITGDHAITTKAIAQKIGMFGKSDIVLTGEELDKLSDKELEKKIDKIRIISRALPIQKSRVVDALQKKGHIVAMTGDGVNDAPALKKADIGIAMGITGTDVAKEVSKAILTDDNFATIVNAVEEGRSIYNKIILSTKYFLSCNSGEIFTVFLAILLKFPLPLLALQILIMNLLTDNFPALGLGAESVEEGIMKNQPRDPKEKPISKNMFISIIIFGIIMGLGTLLMFIQYKDTDLTRAQTVAFTTLVVFQMFAVLSSRTFKHSFKQLNPFTNKWLSGAIVLSMLIQIAIIYVAPLQVIFGTVALPATDWIMIIAISSLGFIIMEASKFIIVKPNHN